MLPCRYFLHVVVAALTLGGLLTSPPARTEPTRVAFIDVNVVPLDSDRVLRHQTVLIENDRIAPIGTTAEIEIPASALKVAGGDQTYLLPGLTGRSPRGGPFFVTRSITTFPRISFWQSSMRLAFRDSPSSGMACARWPSRGAAPGTGDGGSCRGVFYTSFARKHDETKIPAVVEATRQSRGYVIPNLSTYATMTEQWGRPEKVAEYMRDPRAKVMSPLRTAVGTLTGGRWVSAEESNTQIETQRKLYQSLY